MTSYKTLILCFLVGFTVMVAGCNGGGAGGGSVSSFTTQPVDNEVVTDEINRVHNPEPASMALMGLGLAALLRRRRSQK